ncbi:MAG TPA: cysteine--tRNA ligase [Candidatus Limnocylindria bacterium]|nr:cysteine--tRNA ligase [Candidatus Limnocylindria bacterium]
MYDSASRTVRPFVSLSAGEVRMYNCGPTVYAPQHIGNLYSYVVADLLRRTLEYSGYRVKQVMNITDVGHIVDDADAGEDKMAVGARRAGKDPLEIADEYTRLFMADRRRLNVLDPDVTPKATDHIPEMIRLIQRLIDKGNAYVAADGVYFDVTTFPGYGTRLNAEAPEQRIAGARVEINENKRHPSDFALWRRAKPGDLQQWDSPWGRGNPGWHIECSAMSMKYLGETFDIHTGGEDHLFPHHECEIAQSEAATGKPFVQYWVHVRFLRVDSEKMAKSKGGFHTLDDVVAWDYDPLAFRLLALGASYRSGLDFTRSGMDAAQSRLERWRRTIRAAYAATRGRVSEPEGEHAITRAFREALADDVNTPKALAAAEQALNLAATVDTDEQERALWMLFDMDRVLGLSLRESATAKDELSVAERELFDEREEARKAGDYAKSDALRKQLLERFGVQVKDTKDGARWERVGRKGA